MAKFSLRKINKELNPLKDHFSDEELAAISKHGTIINIAPGQVLMEEGTAGSEVAIIVDGQAKVIHLGNLVNHLQTGALVGEKAVLQNRPRGASVTAVTFLKISVLTTEAFANTLRDSNDFRRRVDGVVQHRAA